MRFNSLFLFTQINSLIVHLKSVRAHSFANAPGLSEPRTNEKNYLIREGSSFFIAGVIVPARDRDLGTCSRCSGAKLAELVSEALDARTYFLNEGISTSGEKLRGIIGADGAVSISSYAGGGP